MPIKEIVQRLKTAMDDARGQESHFESWLTQNEGICDAIDALKELDKPEQEPVAWISTGPARMIHWTSDKPAYGDDWVPLYTTPPQRKPLTDEEIGGITKNYALNNPTTPLHFARAIEAAHNIKE